MEFEPLLSLHEPLGATVEDSTVRSYYQLPLLLWQRAFQNPALPWLEEPAEIFSVGKGGKRNKRLEEAGAWMCRC